MSAGLTRGMVLAAGLGTRMRAVSETIPKPLVPLAGKPLIAHALESLERAGATEVVVNTHHLAAQIESFLADYAARPGAPRIRVSREEERLETGGGVRQALGWLGGDAFYVLNSDAVIAERGAPALARLAGAWDEEAMDALLLLCPLARALGCGGRATSSAIATGASAGAAQRQPRPISSLACSSSIPGSSRTRPPAPIR